MAIPRNLANIAPHVNASSTELVVNDGGANLDFRVEGDTNANLLFVDAGNDRIGVSTNAPSGRLDVSYGAGSNIPAILLGADALAFGSTTRTNNTQKFGTIGGAPYANADGFYTVLSYGSNSGVNGVSIGGGTSALNSATQILFYTSANTTTTTGTERARITSGGFFKASNDGTYLNSTGTYHELKSTITDYPVLFIQNSSASFSGSASIQHSAGSAASSAYTFYEAYSSGTSDKEFNLRGDGNGYADGTWNNNGADYAEFFESANGEALTLGATVVLDGNKVREATDQDPASSIIGVVRPKEPSKASMVVGNTAWNKWANKYLTDDFDRYIMEDHDVVEWEETITDEEGKTSTKQHSYESHNIPAGITVPADAVRKTHDNKGNKFQHYRLNPAWNPDSEYVNREDRPEWNIIGLLGQVKILKGQPVGDRWVKMRNVSQSVEEWFIR